MQTFKLIAVQRTKILRKLWCVVSTNRKGVGEVLRQYTVILRTGVGSTEYKSIAILFSTDFDGQVRRRSIFYNIV